jgi:pimeloyl-ACP methyl ester carboxylesterase
VTHFTTKDGLKLSYSDEGTGPGAPLLCLAGLTRNGADFDFFAEAIRAAGVTRRIIRLDARGRGASDHDSNFSNYNIMIETGDAIALLDHLGVEKAVIIGSSRGGFQAMVMAATAPHRLAGVVLNDVGPELDPRGLGKIMSYLSLPPQAKTLTEAAIALKAGFGTDFDVEDSHWEQMALRSYHVTDDGLALTYDPKLRDAVIEQAAALDTKGPGLWPLFETLKPVPTIVLRAENSNLLSAEIVAKMQAAKPDLTETVVMGRGHIPRLDEPEAVAAVVAFLEGLGS